MVGREDSPEPGGQAPAGQPGDHHRVERTRTSTLWTSVVVAAIVLLLLLIFILQNQQDVDISYFGASGSLPLGVALLFSAVGGALLVVLLGTARILQLRHVARRHRRRDRAAAVTPASDPPAAVTPASDPPASGPPAASGPSSAPPPPGS